LERDRRTITRALRHTKPDGKERGQPRWKLKTILEALDQLPGSSNAPKSVSNVTGEVAGKIFRAGECLARANDALPALGEMPDDRDFRCAEFGRVFDLIEDLRSAFEKATESDEEPEPIRYLLGRMVSGLLYATGIRIADDDGTPFVQEKDVQVYEPPAR
jgi:hypothetical protein